MWTETATFDVNNATKNYKKILDLILYKGSGMLGLGGSIDLSYASCRSVKEEFLSKTLKIIHVVCDNSVASYVNIVLRER